MAHQVGMRRDFVGDLAGSLGRALMALNYATREIVTEALGTKPRQTIAADSGAAILKVPRRCAKTARFCLSPIIAMETTVMQNIAVA